MSDKIKNIIVTICFMILIFGILILNVIMPDKDVSKSERRKLPVSAESDFFDADSGKPDLSAALSWSGKADRKSGKRRDARSPGTGDTGF